MTDYVEENMDEMVMSDYGGSGHSLTIPAFMIDLDSSDLIKASIKSGNDVILSAQLTIQKPDD